MATFESKNFIIDLVKQLNLNNMDDATRARLDDLQKKGLATKKQMEWEPRSPDDPRGLVPTITEKEGGTYKYNGSTTEPTVKDLEELYKKIIVILREIEADSDLKENEPTKKFLETFYGSGLAVEKFEIKKLPASKAKKIAKYINSNLDDYTNFFNGEIKEKDLKSLVEKLKDGKYVSDTKALKTLDKFLEKINYYYQWDNSRPLPTKNLPDFLGTEEEIDGVKYAALNVKGITDLRKQIDTPKIPDDLSNFDKGLPYLLNELVKKEKLFEKFASKDAEGSISKWITKGINETNYKTGDHALTPKYKDRKQFWDNAKDKINEWYVNTLGKLEQKHARHIYQTNARYIVAEMIKKGVKPTDGTGKILETMDAIRGDLPNPVQKQLDWIKDTLTPMSKMNFFKDALRDGDQMNVLVSEIIKAAAHDDKEKEAMVALEMLAVMRYTMFTSSVRDQLKKTEFKLFSDGNLSFNKGNKFMQSLTKALDNTLQFGMMAAFEVGNLAKNAIKQQGLRFGKGKESLDERISKSNEYTDTDKQKMIERLMGFWNEVNSSANTKDYNIFRYHNKKQEQADDKNPGTVDVKLAGVSTPLTHETNQQKIYLEYLKNNNIGREA